MKKVGYIVIVVLVIINSIFLFLPKEDNIKIGYINMEEFFAKYKGTIEANEDVTFKKETLKREVDSLESILNLELSVLKETQNSIPEEELMKQKNVLAGKQKAYYNYTMSAEQKISNEEQQLFSGIYMQITEFVEKYKKENEYDLIILSSMESNPVFGSKEYNITQDVLTKINNEYTGE